MSHGGIRAALRQLRHEAVLQTARGDGELLERFAASRDEAAFTILVERHEPMVLRICRRILDHAQDAEDACQATFLILVRNAALIRKRGSVASWLFGVAVRTARQLRRNRELYARLFSGRQVEVLASTAIDPSWREIQDMLDDELLRLPEKYRAPLVLCYLEGLTRPVAARRLGLSPNRFRSRLDYGRRLLRGRLSLRGAELPAVLLTALVACETPASLPAIQAATTAKAAAITTAQRVLTAELVSAQVLNLTERMVRSMFVARFAIRSVSLLVLIGLGFGFAAMMHQVPAAEPSVKKSDDSAPARGLSQQETPAEQPKRDLNPHDQAVQCLNKHYALADGEVLKALRPPLPELRKTVFQYLDAGMNSKKITGVDLDGNLILKWKTDHLKFDSVSFGGQGFAVGSLPWLLLRIAPEEVEGDKDLLSTIIPGPGDFVIREGAPPAKVIASLEEILNKEIKIPVKMTLGEMDRKFYVLTGKYKFTSAMPGAEENHIELYTKELLPGGGLPLEEGEIGVYSLRPPGVQPDNSFPAFVRALSVYLGKRIELGQTEGLPAHVAWRAHCRFPPTPESLEADRAPGQVLLRVLEQTGLSLHVETRRIRVLLVERKK